MTKIDEVRRKTRRRLQTILRHLAGVEGADSLSLTLKELSREELLSERQHLKACYFFNSIYFSITNRPLGHYMLDSSQLKSVFQ